MADYASPTPSDGGNTEPKKITFRFCADCSNLLYPRENPEDRNSLQFACRTCNYYTEADTSCIYRNEMSNTAAETAGVTSDLGQDPTLPRSNKPCPKCGETEAVFFQSQQRTAETGMVCYPFVWTTSNSSS
ncbi:DNA-directed RNA polymerase II subunit RPB9 [Diplodia seriata]|uniref:DNA-directed RNA polymerase II subunit RPB9 n=1 Tax=Diplodia seriata TaxID=420778 RepID=A0A1S8B8H7_9PEZI|nr:DNA-directed RNA polymerase II subunit RPB9 [Diplodia seriata]